MAAYFLKIALKAVVWAEMSLDRVEGFLYKRARRRFIDNS